METIPKSDCEKIGFFRKRNGVHGELVFEFEPRFKYSVGDTYRFFVEIDGLLAPFFLAENGLRFKSANSAIIKFDGIDTEIYARRLVGNPVYLFQNEIVYISEEFVELYLLNYILVDEKLGEIGNVSKVDDFSGNVVLTVNYRGEEILVPFNKDFLVSIDEEQNTVILKLPEGLIQI